MFKLNFHSIKMWCTRKRKAFTVSFAAELIVICTVEIRVVGILPSLALGLALIFPALSWLRDLNHTKTNVSSAAFAFCLIWFAACAQYSELGVLCLARRRAWSV